MILTQEKIDELRKMINDADSIKIFSRNPDIQQSLRVLLDTAEHYMKEARSTKELKLSELSDNEKEVVKTINADYKYVFDRENAVIKTMTKRAGHGLADLAIIGSLCKIIQKLTD